MFRILALDGGGIKGTFTVGVLVELERLTGRRIADHFDLIVGTSTGGILALGLGLGLDVKTLLELYVKRGPDIFPASGFLGGYRGLFRQFWGARYRQEVLRRVLHEYLGERRLGESAVPLVIPTYEALQGRLYLMKTAHHRRFSADHRALAVDVAVATAAAPTYFRQAQFPLRPGESYLDGGLWANTPTMVGLVEAVRFFEQPLENIDILSIGTTDVTRSFSDFRSAGVLGWNVRLIDVLMSAQAEAALAQAGLLLGRRVLRIDTVRPPGTYALDKATPQKISELAALGAAVAREAENAAAVEQRFLNGTAATRYQAFHTAGPATTAA